MMVLHVDRFPNREPRIEDGIHAKMTFAPRQPGGRVVHAARDRKAADGRVDHALEDFSFTRLEEAVDCHVVTF